MHFKSDSGKQGEALVRWWPALGESTAPEVAEAWGRVSTSAHRLQETTGNHKLGLHVAIIWHNTIRLFFFFFLLNIRQLAKT